MMVDVQNDTESEAERDMRERVAALAQSLARLGIPDDSAVAWRDPAPRVIPPDKTS